VVAVTTTDRLVVTRRQPPGGTIGPRHLALVRPSPPVTAARFRRRRIVAAILAATVVAGVALAIWAAQGTPGGDLTAPGRSTPAAGRTAVVQVAPGDTIWSIARRIQSSGDVRPLVDRLVAVHGGAVLQVGERIEVPR
jgi:hypothetical protein